MKRGLLYLSRRDVERVGLPMRSIIGALEQMFKLKGQGRVEMPPKPGIHPRPDAFIHAMPAYIPGMKSAGIKKLVAVTGFGAGDSEPAINLFQRLPFKLILKNAYDDKSIQEELIAKSDLDWIIVRPGVLTNGPASDNYRVLSKPSEWRNGIVARSDVADFIVKRIEAGTLNREKPVIIRIPL